MSLDIMFNKVQLTEVASENITHNVSAMWHEAGIYDLLYNSEGKLAKDIVDGLENGFKDMYAHPAKYEMLNSPNGWGTYPHALDFLTRVIQDCYKFPDSTIEISK
jgi:hypothetical protein